MNELRENNRYWFTVRYPWENEDTIMRATFVRIDYASYMGGERDYLHVKHYENINGIPQTGTLSMPYEWVIQYKTLRQVIPDIELPDDILYSINAFV